MLDGLEDFVIFDEIYGNEEISENVNPLIKTDHDGSMPYLGFGRSKQVNSNFRSV